MTGLCDYSYVVRRVRLAIQTHEVHHYVGSTILNLLSEMESLVEQTAQAEDPHGALAILNQLLTLEQQINQLMLVGKLSKQIQQARFNAAWKTSTKP